MGDISVGDEVIAQDGTPTKVTAVYPQGKLPIYKITFKDGRTARCCADHLWKVYRADWSGTGWRVIDTKEMVRIHSLKSGYKRLYIPHIIPEDGEEKEFPVDPYLLGVLLGDGGLTTRVTFSSADAEIVQAVQDLVPAECVVNYLSQYDYSITQPTSSNNVLLNSLRELGVHGKTSYNKFIPEMYFEGNREQRLHLLQGLLDTDGDVGKNGAICFCSVSKALADGVCKLVWSLGGQARISERQTYYTYKGVKKAGALSYRVGIRLRNPREAFRLPRKIAQTPKNYQYADSNLRIDEIEFDGVAESQCIAVDHPDKLFVIQDYIVTHNTYVPARVYAEQLLKGEIEKLYVARPNVAKPKHRMGYLPGSAEEKTAPWLVPIMEGVRDSMGSSDFQRLKHEKKIEEVPYEFIQGRTFRNAACIVDEAENLDLDDLYITLTRQGEDLSMVLCGDIYQARIRDSGLAQVIQMAKAPWMESVGIIEFDEDDIVRSNQARQWAKAFRNHQTLNFTTEHATDQGELPAFITGKD